MGLALVTGASAGLGLDFAKLFAADGHSVILVARRKDRLDVIAAELQKKFPKIHVTTIEEDLGLPGSGRALFDKVRALNLSVDYLVNNAGFGSAGSFADLPLVKELQMIDLNVRTLVELTHLFLPEMIQRKSGKILNVGSTAGFQPGPYMSVYYASKAFVNSFSLGLHEELRGTGVTCTVLAPGATATEFAQSANAEDSLLFKIFPVASSSDVAAYGYKKMFQGKDLAIHGFSNRFAVQLLRVLPGCVIRKITARANSKS